MRRARLRLALFVIALVATLAPVAADVVIPNHWDPRRRIERPNLAGFSGPVRFLTAPDHPPFNFLNARDELTGFNVELTRAMCAELSLPCTIQAREFTTLMPALRENRGDVVVAGIAPTPQLRREFDLSETYLRSPARFVVPRASTLLRLDPEEMEGKRIGVEVGTAHAAYLDTFFTGAAIVRFDTAAEMRTALTHGEVDAIFGDGVHLAFWLNGSASQACCAFRGGPYTESRFFGEGYAMVFRPGADLLRRAFDHALQRLHEKGTYAELYLRWFPVGLY